MLSAVLPKARTSPPHTMYVKGHMRFGYYTVGTGACRRIGRKHGVGTEEVLVRL